MGAWVHGWLGAWVGGPLSERVYTHLQVRIVCVRVTGLVRDVLEAASVGRSFS